MSTILLSFLKTIKWKTTGDVNVTINELLELPKEKLNQRVEDIYRELTVFLPDAGIKESGWLKKSFESNVWTLDNLGAIFTYLKRHIEYWSWRTDLSEASKNRVAFAFSYLIAVRHVGKENADEIVKNAPPNFPQYSILPQLLEDFQQI